MSFLSAENLSKYYGELQLFGELDLHINQGEKIALVARNGTGKSSLFRILAGIEEPDAGTVTTHPDLKRAFLEQDPQLDPAATVFETVFDSDNPLMRAVSAYERIVLLGQSGPELDHAIGEVDRLNGWDADVRVKQILGKLNIHQFDARISTLSGGQRKRVALAKVLVGEPDLLMLDEPTNHLDLDMIEWLENFLTVQRKTLLMVTHDRYFLDRVCNVIYELDEGKLKKYKGNYAYYLEKKAAFTEQNKTETRRAKSLYKTELEWARRMPKARGTKNKARLDSIGELRQKASRQIAESELSIEIQVPRLGSKMLELHSVTKSYDDKCLIRDFTYKFKRGEKVGLIGPNGSGKSTILNIINSLVQPDSGKVVIGETVVMGYYSQGGIQLSSDKRLIEVVRDVAEYLPLNAGRKLTAAQLLERFGFDRKQQYQYASTLSGGERRRLYLLTVLMQNPNFLILDEPTNDLDIITLNLLEDFLIQYSGCLLVVTHDRYFMDKLVEHCFVLTGDGNWRDYPGNYSQYRQAAALEKEALRSTDSAQKTGQKNLAKINAGKSDASKPVKSDQVKLSYNERKEFNKLEKEIDKLEQRKADVETALGEVASDHEKLMELSDELGQLLSLIEEKSDRWLELADRA